MDPFVWSHYQYQFAMAQQQAHARACAIAYAQSQAHAIARPSAEAQAYAATIAQTYRYPSVTTAPSSTAAPTERSSTQSSASTGLTSAILNYHERQYRTDVWGRHQYPIPPAPSKPPSVPTIPTGSSVYSSIPDTESEAPTYRTEPSSKSSSKSSYSSSTSASGHDIRFFVDVRGVVHVIGLVDDNLLKELRKEKLKIQEAAEGRALYERAADVEARARHIAGKQRPPAPPELAKRGIYHLVTYTQKADGRERCKIQIYRDAPEGYTINYNPITRRWW